MRGKETTDREVSSNYRITPAYAGKSRYEVYVDANDMDHPRLCGEKFRFLEISPAHEGSPPPMRGKAKCGSDNVSVQGITPAYAGKRKSRSQNARIVGDHPRLCGEKCYILVTKSGNSGSPPPMRGKASNCCLVSSSIRITPAYAGKRKGGV